MGGYIVSCGICGQEGLIELAAPEEISRAACPICQGEEALLPVSSAAEYMPSPQEIAALLDIDGDRST